jgi:hypothetical protein
VKVNRESSRDQVENQVMEHLILENRQLKAIINQKNKEILSGKEDSAREEIQRLSEEVALL